MVSDTISFLFTAGPFSRIFQALCSHRHVVLNCRSVAMSKDPSRPGCWLLPHSFVQMEKMNKLAPNLFYEMIDMKCKGKLVYYTGSFSLS